MQQVEQMDPSQAQTVASTRRSQRVRMRKAVRIRWHENGTSPCHDTYTLSVSRFGCLLMSQQDFLPGTTVLVEHGGKTMVGKVSYSLKNHDTRRVELGIGFELDGSDFWELQFAD